MNNKLIDIITISSDGLVTLPKEMIDSLSLKGGSKLMVCYDGTNILLKPIDNNIDEVNNLMNKVNDWAKDVGLKEEDIKAAIKTVRRKS